jgi:type II secretory pathway pseudopilin PulG
MEPLVVLIILAVVIALVVSRSRKRQVEAKAQADAVALNNVKAVAEEDVTRLGEDVSRLDVDTTGRDLDEAERQDYRRALDAYDAAKAAMGRVNKPDDIREVTAILEDGRYAIASLRARLAGEPLPARRPPCFFNPQHGPSSDDVDWAPPGGAPRSVPACAADAERVRAGAEPDVRKVAVGAGRRPYWEAGRGYGGYAQGYFSPYANSGLLPGVLLGAVLFGGFGGWDGDGSDGGDNGDSGDSGDGGGDSGDGGGDSGDGGGDSGGGYDDASGSFDGGGSDGGGGFDGGGFDGGGFDGGGFDGGGFDGGF